MLRLSGRQNHLKGRPPKLVQDEIYHDVSYHIGWLGGIYDDTCIRIISWRVTQGEHDQGLPLPQIQASNSMATEVIRHPRSPPDTFRHHPLASFLSPQKWLLEACPFTPQSCPTCGASPWSIPVPGVSTDPISATRPFETTRPFSSEGLSPVAKEEKQTPHQSKEETPSF